MRKGRNSAPRSACVSLAPHRGVEVPRRMEANGMHRPVVALIALCRERRVGSKRRVGSGFEAGSTFFWPSAAHTRFWPSSDRARGGSGEAHRARRQSWRRRCAATCPSPPPRSARAAGRRPQSPPGKASCTSGPEQSCRRGVGEEGRDENRAGGTRSGPAGLAAEPAPRSRRTKVYGFGERAPRPVPHLHVLPARRRDEPSVGGHLRVAAGQTAARALLRRSAGETTRRTDWRTRTNRGAGPPGAARLYVRHRSGRV